MAVKASDDLERIKKLCFEIMDKLESEYAVFDDGTIDSWRNANAVEAYANVEEISNDLEEEDLNGDTELNRLQDILSEYESEIETRHPIRLAVTNQLGICYPDNFWDKFTNIVNGSFISIVLENLEKANELDLTKEENLEGEENNAVDYTETANEKYFSDGGRSSDVDLWKEVHTIGKEMEDTFISKYSVISSILNAASEEESSPESGVKSPSKQLFEAVGKDRIIAIVETIEEKVENGEIEESEKRKEIARQINSEFLGNCKEFKSSELGTTVNFIEKVGNL